MAGRPTKYTPETVQRIVQAIELGATYELAAQYGGIDYDTFNEWRKQKAEFSEQVKLAESKGVVKWLAKIEQAASDGNWQAAAWKLERRYPHLYGRTVQEQVGKDGGAIKHEHTIDMSKVSDEQLDRILRG